MKIATTVLLLVFFVPLPVATADLANDLPGAVQLDGRPVPLTDWQAYYRVHSQVQVLLANPQSTAKCLANAKGFYALGQSKFTELGLPGYFYALAAAESCGNPNALSSAGAVGGWQMMPTTAKRLGYTVFDLRDPERSAEAAAKYLKELYERFGDPLLVLAAYNTGEENIAQAIKSQGARDFWRLSLASETMTFVPTILAYYLIDTQGWLGDPANPTFVYVPSFKLLPSLPDDPNLAKVKLRILASDITIPWLAQWGGVSTAKFLGDNPQFNVVNWGKIPLPKGETMEVLVSKEFEEKFISNLQQISPPPVEVVQ